MKKEAFEKWMGLIAGKVERSLSDTVGENGGTPDVFLHLYEEEYYMIMHLDKKEGCYSYVLHIDKFTYAVKQESASLQRGLDGEEVEMKGEDDMLKTFTELVDLTVKQEEKKRKLHEFYDATVELVP